MLFKLFQMPPESSPQNSGVQLAVFRHLISGILLHSTIYDVVPVSSKVRFFLD
jgi:5'-AMP-activated protein kinase, regulatory gamma subunit